MAKAPVLHKAQVTHPLEEGNYDLVSIGDGVSPEQTYRIDPRDYSKVAESATNRMQQLAMGEGIPVDLTFGVGADGEAPLHLQTVAESVHNGALDPNAPEALPYAHIVGSGSDDHVSAVGYLQ